MGEIIPILGTLCGLLVIFGGVFLKPWFAQKQRELDLTASLTAEKTAQNAAQTERLEQRVRVLERIITDRGHDLAGEIENLRGMPAALSDREH